MRKSGNLSRRAFLQGVGATTLCLPFLSSLSSGSAQAQTQGPTRLVVVFYSHGTQKSRFTPGSTGALGTLPQLLAPFEPYKSQLNVLTGIDNIVNALNHRTNGHNGAARSLLTCQPFQGVKQGAQPDNAAADGPSIDWVLGPKLKGGMPRAVVNLGITDADVGENGVFWRSAGESATLLTNPRTAADTLFAGVGDNTTSDAPKTPEQLYAARKKNIVTSVADSVKRLQKRVASEDRVRLEAHLQQVEGLEALLGGIAGGLSCAKPTFALPGGYAPNNVDMENISAAAQIENAVMTLACNIAPVVTMQFLEYQNPNFQFLFNGDRTAVLRGNNTYNGWHAMVHEAGDARDAVGVDHLSTGFTFYMQQVANLWKRLSEVEDTPGKTLAQSTLVLAISEFGDGAHHVTHELPVILLGDLGGKVQTGQHRNMKGYTTGDLFTTLQAITTGETTPFGMTGTLTGGKPGWPYDVDNGRPYHKGLLPGLT
jgi:hypothetical protein